MRNKNLTIAVTYTGTEEKHHKYVNWLKDADDIEIVKLSAEENNLERLLECDAVVMSGGIDAHPKHYGSSITNYPNAPEQFNEARDEFEISVFHLAQKQQLPLLCICRGMQLANCILGGDLIQDLGELNEKHRNKEAEKKHPILIEPGTLLHSITDKEKDIADSAHHQCINRLGKGLMINAKSNDGIIEGVEWEDKNGKAFFLGVQWHPERMYMQGLESSTLSKNIREYFLSEAIKNKH